jgi:hypothetical protein
MSALDNIVSLAWHAPFAAVSHFDVVACWSEFLFDDMSEVRRHERTFRVSFECLPFARSVDESTIEWTGVGTELNPCTSLTGWTVVSGSADINDGNIHVGTGSIRLAKTVTVDEYLWVKVDVGSHLVTGAVTAVTVDGVAIPQAEIRQEMTPLTGLTQILTVPTAAWRGQSVEVAFTLAPGAAWLREFWTVSYPVATELLDIDGILEPRGVGVVDVGGTARTPATIRFTAPAGGAFVYTAPDPNTQIRSGSGETVFAAFSVADPDGGEVEVDGRLMWFPQGDHATHIGFTDPQPSELNPDGIWPQEATGLVTGGARRRTYPTDGRAAISFFNTTGDKALISPRPTLPTGYSGDAVAHEVHALYPGLSGFAVLDEDGDPIPATITYYKRWKHHAAD